MAENRIGRTIKKTTVEGEYFDKEFRKQHFCITIYGEKTVKQMANYVSRVLNTDTFMIDPKTIRHEEFYASMSVEEFVKLAEHKPTNKQKEIENV